MGMLTVPSLKGSPTHLRRDIVPRPAVAQLDGWAVDGRARCTVYPGCGRAGARLRARNGRGARGKREGPVNESGEQLGHLVCREEEGKWCKAVVRYWPVDKDLICARMLCSSAVHTFATSSFRAAAVLYLSASLYHMAYPRGRCPAWQLHLSQTLN